MLRLDTKKYLRNTIHDIVIQLSKDEGMLIVTLCDILKKEYNIYIDSQYIKKLLENWSNMKKTSVLFQSDKKWLLYKNGLLYNNVFYKDVVLGKSHRNIKKLK